MEGGGFWESHLLSPAWRSHSGKVLFGDQLVPVSRLEAPVPEVTLASAPQVMCGTFQTVTACPRSDRLLIFQSQECENELAENEEKEVCFWSGPGHFAS